MSSGPELETGIGKIRPAVGYERRWYGGRDYSAGYGGSLNWSKAISLRSQIQLDAAAAGTLNVMGDNLAGKSGADMDRFSEMESAAGVGDLEFAALIRKIDKTDTSCRCRFRQSSSRPERSGVEGPCFSD